MKKTLVLFTLLLHVFILPACAAEGDPVATEILVLDTPTTETLDRYQASFTTRAYDHGTVMESIDFGVYPRLNVGISLAVHELLGSSSSVRVLNPDFQAKWKIFDGDMYWPSIAIGYDGRQYGYGYNNQRKYAKTKDYLDERRGGYLVLSHEVLLPGLQLNGGVNFSDFEWKKVDLFTGAYYKIIDTISVLAEWDNIHNLRDSRANAGLRFYLHPSLALDGAVRRIGRGKESERILQIRYVTNF